MDSGGYVLINDLRFSKHRLIRQLRLLQFPPFLLGRSFLQFRLERQKPIADCRIILDIDFAFRRVDEEKALRLNAPALDVLAAQEWPEQLCRFLVLLDQPVARFLVDDECRR